VERAQRNHIHALLVRLADGDRGAFHPFFELSWPVVKSFSQRLLSNPADAEDAAQNALMKVLAQSSAFDPKRDALSWMLSITAYECLTLRRKTWRRRETGDESGLDASPSPHASPEWLAVQRDLETAAQELLGTLSPTEMDTLKRAMAGETEPLGVAPATFRKRLQRALEALRRAWKERHGFP